MRRGTSNPIQAGESAYPPQERRPDRLASCTNSSKKSPYSATSTRAYRAWSPVLAGSSSLQARRCTSWMTLPKLRPKTRAPMIASAAELQSAAMSPRSGRFERARPSVPRGGSLDQAPRERGRLPLEVLDHDQQRRDDGDQDVGREEQRLERPVDRLVAPPGADRDSLRGANVPPDAPPIRRRRS